jgi:hypothetical protein
VGGVLAGSRGAIVTAEAGAGCDIGMIKGGSLPYAGGMTVIAGVAAGDVIGCFAGSRYAVVTAEAGATNGIVVHARKWFPELICVTFFA